LGTLILVVLLIISAFATLWWRRRGQDQAGSSDPHDAHIHRNDGHNRMGGEGGNG